MEETRRAMEEGDLDVVLLDLTLPDSPMDATIQAIEELARHGVPIVATSSLDEQDVREAVLARGAAAFLGKARMVAEYLAATFDGTDGFEALNPSPRARGRGRGAPPRPRSWRTTRTPGSRTPPSGSRPCAPPPVGRAGHGAPRQHRGEPRAFASIAAERAVCRRRRAVECEPITLDAAPDGWRAPTGGGEVEVRVGRSRPCPPTGACSPRCSRSARTTSRGTAKGPLGWNFAPADEEFVRVLAEDSGGPWSVDGERDLTELGTRGTRRTPTAGVGRHRAAA